MVNSCLFVMMTFLSSHQFTGTNGWFMYDFKERNNEFLVHTWVTEGDKLIKFVISKDPNLNVLPGRIILNKTMCIEKDLPYTAYEVLLPRE